MAHHAVHARRVALLLLAACAHAPAPIAKPLPPSYVLGALRVDGAPPLDDAIAAELAPFARVLAQRVLDVSDDGSAALALSGGQVVELRGGAVIARGRDATWAAFAGSGVVALADRDGDEDSHLERDGARLAARAARQVEPVSAHGHLAWAEIAPGGVDSELWLDDRRVFAGQGAWVVDDIAADGRTLLARHGDTPDTSALVRIDVATGARVGRELAARTGKLAPDGAVIAISAAGLERAVVERDGVPFAALAGADATSLAITSRGQIASIFDDDRGESTLVIGTDLVATGGVMSDLHAAGAAEVIGYTRSDARHAKTAIRYDLAAAHGEPFAAIASPIDPDALVDAEPADARAADGTRIPLLASLPSTPHPGGRAPVVIVLHGGPEDRASPRYDGFVQFLVHRGYAVVQPDYRGSAGHGRAFAALDDGALRAGVVGDVAATLDWIATRRELDAQRVAVLGTSYGGYLALAATLAFPDRLRGAIALSPIVDLASFLATTRADRRAARRAEYGDERDPSTRARLAALSPLTHASALRRPVLIAAGERDSRVTTGATLRWIDAARRAGVAVWSLVASDEGHGFVHAENRGAYEVLVAQFLARVFE